MLLWLVSSGSDQNSMPREAVCAVDLGHLFLLVCDGVEVQFRIYMSPCLQVVGHKTITLRTRRSFHVVLLSVMKLSWTSVLPFRLAMASTPLQKVVLRLRWLVWLPRPLPLAELARVVAKLGFDHGLYQRVLQRVQSVPVVGAVNVLGRTAASTYMHHTYIHTHIHTCIQTTNGGTY